MNMLTKITDQENLEGLREQFEALDKDGTGYINASELRAAMKENKFRFYEDQVDLIISKVDYFGNNLINYTEFLVATLDMKTCLDEDKMVQLFNQFDTDNSGNITKDNIKSAMNKLGHNITQAELDQIMNKHDLQGDNVLSLFEFKALLLDYDNLKEAK